NGKVSSTSSSTASPAPASHETSSGKSAEARVNVPLKSTPPKIAMSLSKSCSARPTRNPTVRVPRQVAITPRSPNAASIRYRPKPVGGWGGSSMGESHATCAAAPPALHNVNANTRPASRFLIELLRVVPSCMVARPPNSPPPRRPCHARARTRAARQKRTTPEAASGAHHRVRLDLHEDRRIDEPGHHDERRRRCCVVEGLAVRAADLRPVRGIGDVHARAHHVLRPRTRLAQRRRDDLEATARLAVRVAEVRDPALVVHRRRAGDVDVIPHTDCTRVAHRRRPWRRRRDSPP